MRELPQTKYGMHNFIIDLAKILSNTSFGQDWDLKNENLELFVEAEKMLLGEGFDYKQFDKEEPPAGYENLPYKVEDSHPHEVA